MDIAFLTWNYKSKACRKQGRFKGDDECADAQRGDWTEGTGASAKASNCRKPLPCENS